MLVKFSFIYPLVDINWIDDSLDLPPVGRTKKDMFMQTDTVEGETGSDIDW